MAQIIFLLMQLLLFLCCVTGARRLAPLIADDTGRRQSRNAGNDICDVHTRLSASGCTAGAQVDVLLLGLRRYINC
jgi:hypothetical protein